MNMPRPGESFARRYRVEGTLGAGGFGAVFLATDTEMSRRVALKVLRPDRADGYEAATRARFEREVRIVANLRNPHTVALYDTGEWEGALYMALEYVPGEDLSELLARVGTLTPHATAHILIQLTTSLQEAHEAGLLHRDIKPANVRVFDYLGDPLTVKLLDFGLARPVDRQHGGITEAGQLVGTPRYMAPEQLLERDLSPATDIYSLGVLALEMLFGPDVLPGGRWSDQFDRLQSGHVFSVPELERVGTAFMTIIERMTARDPSARYQSAAAVRAALTTMAAGATLPTMPPPRARKPIAHTAVGPSVERRPRSRLPLAVGVGVVVLVVIAGIFALRGGDADPRTTAPAPSQRDNPIGAPREQRAKVGVVPPPIATADAGGEPDATAPDMAPAARPARSAGCGRAVETTGLGNFGNRQVYGYVPRGYDPERAYPVVIALHQGGSTPEEMLGTSGLIKLAQRDGAVLLAPRGNPVLTWLGGRDDVDLVRADLDDAAKRLCLDLTRVFVAAQGQGGDLTRRMMCEPWITAIGTNSFRPAAELRYCAPERPIPHIMLSPINNPRNPPAGGMPCGIAQVFNPRVVISLRDAEEEWLQLNQCDADSRKVTVKRGKSRCYAWDCATPFESCHLDGGHNWPGSPPREGACDGVPPKFPVGETMWKFFFAAPALPSAG